MLWTKISTLIKKMLNPSELSWSEWLEFNSDQVKNVSNKPGVFRMHASMKMYYIGSSDDIKTALTEKLSDECISKAKRFCYADCERHEKISDMLLEDFKHKHNGELPKCMKNSL